MVGTQECRVYEFEVLDPRTGYSTTTVGYIGETARMPFARLMEHVNSQPWSDTIVSWRVLPGVYPDKPAVLVAEGAAIKDRLPLYNYEGNLDNPQRIPIPEARRQRAARDAAKGVAAWTPPAGGGPSRRPARRHPATVGTRHVQRPQRRHRWQLRTVQVLLLWLVLAVALFLLIPSHVPAGTAVEGSAVASALLMVAWPVLKPRRRRRRRRR